MQPQETIADPIAGASSSKSPTPMTLDEALAENAKLRDDNLKLGKFAVRVRRHALELRLPDRLQNSLLLAGILAEADKMVGINRAALVAVDEDEELKKLRAERVSHKAAIDKEKSELREARRKAEEAIAEAAARAQHAQDRLAGVRQQLYLLYDSARIDHHWSFAKAIKEVLDAACETNAKASFFIVDRDARNGGAAAEYVIKGRPSGTKACYLSSVFMGGNVVDWGSTEKQSEALRCDAVTARQMARLFHARAVRLRPRSATGS